MEKPNRNITNANDILLWRWIDYVESENKVLKKSLSYFENTKLPMAPSENVD